MVFDLHQCCCMGMSYGDDTICTVCYGDCQTIFRFIVYCGDGDSEQRRGAAACFYLRWRCTACVFGLHWTYTGQRMICEPRVCFQLK